MGNRQKIKRGLAAVFPVAPWQYQNGCRRERAHLLAPAVRSSFDLFLLICLVNRFCSLTALSHRWYGAALKRGWVKCRVNLSTLRHWSSTFRATSETALPRTMTDPKCSQCSERNPHAF